MSATSELPKFLQDDLNGDDGFEVEEEGGHKVPPTINRSEDPEDEDNPEELDVPEDMSYLLHPFSSEEFVSTIDGGDSTQARMDTRQGEAKKQDGGICNGIPLAHSAPSESADVQAEQLADPQLTEHPDESQLHSYAPNVPHRGAISTALNRPSSVSCPMVSIRKLRTNTCAYPIYRSVPENTNSLSASDAGDMEPLPPVKTLIEETDNRTGTCLDAKSSEVASAIQLNRLQGCVRHGGFDPFCAQCVPAELQASHNADGHRSGDNLHKTENDQQAQYSPHLSSASPRQIPRASGSKHMTPLQTPTAVSAAEEALGLNSFRKLSLNTSGKAVLDVTTNACDTTSAGFSATPTAFANAMSPSMDASIMAHLQNAALGQALAATSQQADDVPKQRSGKPPLHSTDIRPTAAISSAITKRGFKQSCGRRASKRAPKASKSASTPSVCPETFPTLSSATSPSASLVMSHAEAAATSPEASQATSQMSSQRSSQKSSQRSSQKSSAVAPRKAPRKSADGRTEKAIVKKSTKKAAQRAAIVAERMFEEKLAMLANSSQITDQELLNLKPKKTRRAAKFDNATPSRFCHICSRTPKNVQNAVCTNILYGTCRKVICERCFADYDYGDFEAACDLKHGGWYCPHCLLRCPSRAQCTTYGRINDQLRADRLKAATKVKTMRGQQKCGRKGRGKGSRRAKNAAEPNKPKFLLPALKMGNSLANTEDGAEDTSGRAQDATSMGAEPVKPSSMPTLTRPSTPNVDVNSPNLLAVLPDEVGSAEQAGLSAEYFLTATDDSQFGPGHSAQPNNYAEDHAMNLLDVDILPITNVLSETLHVCEDNGEESDELLPLQTSDHITQTMNRAENHPVNAINADRATSVIAPSVPTEILEEDEQEYVDLVSAEVRSSDEADAMQSATADYETMEIEAIVGQESDMPAVDPMLFHGYAPAIRLNSSSETDLEFAQRMRFGGPEPFGSHINTMPASDTIEPMLAAIGIPASIENLGEPSLDKHFWEMEF